MKKLNKFEIELSRKIIQLMQKEMNGRDIGYATLSIVGILTSLIFTTLETYIEEIEDAGRD